MKIAIMGTGNVGSALARLHEERRYRMFGLVD